MHGDSFFHAWLHMALDIALDMAPWLLLGFVLAFFCSYFLSERWMRRHLGGPGWLPIAKASLFGLPLPICSCGVLLVALALRRSGARKAPVCAFLASTPQSGTDALLVSFPLLGPVLTLLRFLGAVLSGFVAGALVRRFGVAQPPPHETEDLAPDCAALCACHHHDHAHPHHHGEAHHHEFSDRRGRLRDAATYAFVHLPGELAPLLALGVLIAAALAAGLPEGLLRGLPLAAAYVLAVLVGIPTYACSLAIVPVAAGLRPSFSWRAPRQRMSPPCWCSAVNWDGGRCFGLSSALSRWRLGWGCSLTFRLRAGSLCRRSPTAMPPTNIWPERSSCCRC